MLSKDNLDVISSADENSFMTKDVDEWPLATENVIDDDDDAIAIIAPIIQDTTYTVAADNKSATYTITIVEQGSRVEGENDNFVAGAGEYSVSIFGYGAYAFGLRTKDNITTAPGSGLHDIIVSDVYSVLPADFDIAFDKYTPTHEAEDVAINTSRMQITLEITDASYLSKTVSNNGENFINLPTTLTASDDENNVTLGTWAYIDAPALTLTNSDLGFVNSETYS